MPNGIHPDAPAQSVRAEMKPSLRRAPYFVMAHHRSGSNFLNDLLQSHPRIECINEPFSMHTPFFRACDLEPWSVDEFTQDLLYPALDDGLRAYLFDLRKYLSQSNSLRVLGFKDTVLFGKLAWLKAFLPSLKIILRNYSAPTASSG
jgi:LPS sulfotransferase NodH